MNKKVAVFAISLLALLGARASAAQYITPVLANETGLAYNNTYYISIDTAASAQQGIVKMSAQIIYSSMSPTTNTFNGGATSTATITVVSTQSLVALFAKNTVTVPPTTGILAQSATAQMVINSVSNLGSGATSQINVTTTYGSSQTVITLYGAQTLTLTEGAKWSTGATSSTVCLNISTAINAVSAYTNIVSSCPQHQSKAIVYTTTTVNGSDGFGYRITSSNPLLSTNTFSGGVQNAVIVVAGNVLRNQHEWTSQATTSATAASIATAINALGFVDANVGTGTSSTIYSTVTLAGLAGNSTTIISTPSASLTPSATFYSGGHDRQLQNAVLTYDGTPYANGYLWTDASNTSTGTAASIAILLDTFSGIVSSPPANSVVTATVTTSGYAGNTHTLSSNNTNLVVGQSSFYGGQDSATLTIGGIQLLAGVQGSGGFAVGATTAATAANISSAIMNTASLSAIITSTSTANNSGVVWATSTVTGLSANFAIVSSTTGITAPGTGFFGAKTSSFTINTAVITSLAHGYTTGLKVAVSTGSGVALVPFSTGTVYYVIKVDADHLALASSLGNAIAGSSITITSSSTLTTAPTFILTPPINAGTVSWKWQVSNNGGTNWTDLSTPATYTITSYVFPSTSTVVDFGDVNYQMYRLNVTAPTSGGLAIKVPLNGRVAP